jgi:hypothetical protein
LSPDGGTLLFSSDGHAGAGRMDLHTSRVMDGRFAAAEALSGQINTAQDEFDATYLEDGNAVIFTRAVDLTTSDARLYHVVPRQGRYGKGHLLPNEVNTPGSSTYAPMLDWSQPHRLTFTTRRPAASPGAADLYVVKYRP